MFRVKKEGYDHAEFKTDADAITWLTDIYFDEHGTVPPDSYYDQFKIVEEA